MSNRRLWKRSQERVFMPIGVYIRMLPGNRKGSVASEETRNLMSLVRTGKKFTEQTKEKMSEAHQGEKGVLYTGRNTKK